jgi:hypothetical protein
MMPKNALVSSTSVRDTGCAASLLIAALSSFLQQEQQRYDMRQHTLLDGCCGQSVADLQCSWQGMVPCHREEVKAQLRAECKRTGYLLSSASS